MYGYERPGPTQRTNIACHAKLLEALTAKQAVDIYLFRDPEPKLHAGIPINLAAQRGRRRHRYAAWGSARLQAPHESSERGFRHRGRTECHLTETRASWSARKCHPAGPCVPAFGRHRQVPE